MSDKLDNNKVQKAIKLSTGIVTNYTDNKDGTFTCNIKYTDVTVGTTEKIEEGVKCIGIKNTFGITTFKSSVQIPMMHEDNKIFIRYDSSFDDPESAKTILYSLIYLIIKNKVIDFFWFNVYYVKNRF